MGCTDHWYNGFRHDTDPAECAGCGKHIAEAVPVYTEHGMVYCDLRCAQRYCGHCHADLLPQMVMCCSWGTNLRFCDDTCAFAFGSELLEARRMAEAREARDAALDLAHP